MKIATLTIDTGERKNFLRKCREFIYRQTLQPDISYFLTEPSGIKGVDLTWRMKKGLNTLKYFDLIIIFESDDYYADNYIETMVKEWQALGRPDILGIDSTIYYHLETDKYVQINHEGRSSLFSMAFSGKMVDSIEWPPDDTLFLDMWFWKNFKGELISLDPRIPVCIGIKHGIGICGGKGHDKDFRIYATAKNDIDNQWLREIAGNETVDFYKNLMRIGQP